MQCPSCGVSLQEEAKYCPNCGNRIPHTVSRARNGQREALAVTSLPHTPVPREVTSYGLWPNSIEQQPPSSTSQPEPVQAPLPSPVPANPLPAASRPSTTQLLEKLVSMLPTKPDEPTESTPPSISRWKANLLLYGLTIIVTAFLVGSVLSRLGMFPSTIAAATSAFGGSLAAIIGVLGGLLAGSILKEGIRDIWLKANRSLAMLASILTIGVLLMVLFLNADPYLHRGMQVLDDPLRDNSRGYNWDVGKTSSGASTFVNGAFHVRVDKKDWGFYATAENTNFSNFVYEVQMTILKGDCGGLIFRQSLAQPSPHYYRFAVCDDGSYALYRYYATSEYGTFKPAITVHQVDSAPSIHAGLNQTNLIAVAATSSGIELWANRQRLVSLPETTYQGGGFIGVGVHDSTLPTEVTFNNAKVWALP